MCVAIQLLKIYILYVFTFKFNLHSHDNVDNQFLFMILLWIHGISKICVVKSVGSCYRELKFRTCWFDVPY